jgi:hypothetical protein
LLFEKLVEAVSYRLSALSQRNRTGKRASINVNAVDCARSSSRRAAELTSETIGAPCKIRGFRTRYVGPLTGAQLQRVAVQEVSG